MSDTKADILVYGFGNPGRLDDGLGPALAKALEEHPLEGVTVDSNYQLSVEDADTVAAHRVVIFADADTSGPEPFWFVKLVPERAVSFSSHSVQPKALVALAQDLFEVDNEAYILGIRGYEFNEFGEGLSDQAATNLEAAISFIRERIEARCFDELPDGPPAGNDNDETH